MAFKSVMMVLSGGGKSKKVGLRPVHFDNQQVPETEKKIIDNIKMNLKEKQ